MHFDGDELEPNMAKLGIILAVSFALTCLAIVAIKRSERPHCAPGWHVVKTRELGLMCTKALDPRQDLPQERR